VQERLDSYRSSGAGPFDASRGESMWTQHHLQADLGTQVSCASCHGTDLRSAGKHQRTGKVIEAMAPSVNPKRLTDAAKIEKWFTRNCRWTLGRQCTPQEKGDFLAYLNAK